MSHNTKKYLIDVEIDGELSVSTLNASRASTKVLVQDEILGDEEITNGSFNNGTTGWTLTSEAEIVNGAARIYSSDGASQYIDQTGVLVVGKEYKLVYNTTIDNGGALLLNNTHSLSKNIGYNNLYFTAVATGFRIKINGGTTDITIDDISVKEVLSSSNDIQQRGLGDLAFKNLDQLENIAFTNVENTFTENQIIEGNVSSEQIIVADASSGIAGSTITNIKTNTSTGTDVALWSAIDRTTSSSNVNAAYGGVFRVRGFGSNNDGGLVGINPIGRHEGTGGTYYVYGTLARAEQTGSGDIDFITGSDIGALSKGNGTATIDSHKGVNIRTSNTNSSATINYLTGIDIEGELSAGTVGDVNIVLLEWDQTGGSITGDFSFLKIPNDSVSSITGTARAINSLSTLPSLLKGDLYVDTKIGVDNESPGVKLHVGSASLGSAGDQDTDIISTGGITITSGKKLSLDNNYSVHANMRYGNTVSEARFEQQGYYGFNFITRGSTSSMVIQGNTGNVGIGEDDPSSKLEVAGEIKTNIDAAGSSHLSLASGGSGINVNFDFTLGSSLSGLTAKNLEILGSSGSSDIAISPSTSHRGLLMLDGSVGRVGIGTTTPSEKLEVDGDVKADAFKVDGETDASKFLKGDGTLDTNVYLTSATLGTYDNYQSWNLKTNGVQRKTIQSGNDFDLVAGTNVTLSYSAGGVVTINSASFTEVDTLATVTGRTNGATTTTESFFNGGLNTNKLTVHDSTASSTNYKLWVGRNAIEGTGIIVDDAGTIIRTLQDETNTNNHRLTFDLVSASTGDHFYDFQINASQLVKIEEDTTTFQNDVVINGDLSITGTYTQIDTNVNTTEQWLVTNDGTGPAVVVNQKGSQPVIDFQDDGASVFYIEDGGNVGIGITNPRGKLDISVAAQSGVIDYSLRLHNLGIDSISRSSGILFDVGYTDPNRGKGALVYEYDSAGSWNRGDFHFLQNQTTDTSTPTLSDSVMTIKNDGKVGINTTGPTEKLEVVGNIKTDGIFSDGDTDKISDITFYRENTPIDDLASFILSKKDSNYDQTNSTRASGQSNAFGVISLQTHSGNYFTQVGLGTNTNSLYIRSANNATSFGSWKKIITEDDQFATGTGTDNYVVKWDGTSGDLQSSVIYDNGTNVGIGTTSLSNKLEVNGNIQASTYKIAGATVLQGSSTVILGSGGSTGKVKLDTTSGTGLILDASNVGIGTDSPGAKLEIQTLRETGIRLSSSDVTAGVDELLSSIDFYANDTPNEGVKASIQVKYEDVSANSYMTLNTGSNTEQIRITSAGDVGIGTDSPAEKLDVAGNAIVRGDIVSRDTYPSIYVDHSGTVMGGIRADATNKLELKTLTTAPLSFQVNSSEKMRITSTGNVGIGTISPDAKLEVSSGDAQTVIRIENTDTTINTDQEPNAIEFYTNDASSAGTAISAKISQVAESPGNNYGLGFSTYASQLNEKMRLNKDGYLGIGTTDPTRMLHVSGGGNDTLASFHSTDTGSYISFVDVNTTSDQHVQIGGVGDGLAVIVGGVTKFQITDEGKVGINSNPSVDLHIQNSTHPTIRVGGTDNNADPAIELLGTANNFSEGGQLWYDNGTGKLHLSSIYNHDNASIQFHTRTGADRSLANIRMQISGNGNVGINTTGPSEKLMVEGNIALSMGDAMAIMKPKFEGLEFIVGDGIDSSSSVDMSLQDSSTGTGLNVYGYVESAFNTDEDGGGSFRVIRTIDAADNNPRGFSDKTILTNPSTSSISYAGIDINAEMDDGTYEHHTGFQLRTSIETATVGDYEGVYTQAFNFVDATVTNYVGSTTKTPFSFDSDSSITNMIGNHVIAEDASGSVTNLYGLKIETGTSPATNMWSIHAPDVDMNALMSGNLEVGSITCTGAEGASQFTQNSGNLITFGSDTYESKYIEIRPGTSYGLHMGMQSGTNIFSSGTGLVTSSKPISFKAGVASTVGFENITVPHLTIATNGSIGMGTTSATTYRLEVSGTARIDNNGAGEKTALILKNGDSTSANRTTMEFWISNSDYSEISTGANSGYGDMEFRTRVFSSMTTRMKIHGGGNVTIGTTSVSSDRLHVEGTVKSSSTFTGTNFILSSDSRLKQNVEKAEVSHIDVDWKNFELKSEKGQKRYGVIAQELEQKHPEFVRTDDEGMKSVAYVDLLIAKIAELEARLEKAGL